MSEVALLTARKPRLKRGPSRATSSPPRRSRWRDPTRFLSTIQIGITSIGILNGIVGEAFLSSPLSAWLQEIAADHGKRRTSWPPSASWSRSPTCRSWSASSCPSASGSTTPRALRAGRRGRCACSRSFRLRSWGCSASTHAILKPLLLARMRGGEDRRRAVARGDPHHPARVLQRAAEEALSILLNLFDLRGMTVEDIMVPRARSSRWTWTTTSRRSARSSPATTRRRLVFRSALGDVVGVLHVRRCSPRCRPARSTRKRSSMLSDPYFVPRRHAAALADAVLPGEPARASRSWWTSTAS